VLCARFALSGCSQFVGWFGLCFVESVFGWQDYYFPCSFCRVRVICGAVV